MIQSSLSIPSLTTSPLFIPTPSLYLTPHIPPSNRNRPIALVLSALILIATKLLLPFSTSISLLKETQYKPTIAALKHPPHRPLPLNAYFNSPNTSQTEQLPIHPFFTRGPFHITSPVC
ncbi:hypothetical protein PGTUg99_000600 [Puccinia graminis f. sp. tritici]|uniref:Uncharacterized protein n=1 Tax=Puccinia graminis f. sp. tritici TaxID=56615 RepID=A0A5B0P6A0_PUCGR|nr:hypothetical protein PGTUg99_000600 [Puccinia graminis f. sp. tritici]